MFYKKNKKLQQTSEGRQGRIKERSQRRETKMRGLEDRDCEVQYKEKK